MGMAPSQRHTARLCNEFQGICRLTIEEVQEFQVSVLFHFWNGFFRIAILYRVESRQTQVPEIVKVEKLGVGKKGELGIEVEGVLLLLLLLGLVVGRGDGIQVIDVLRVVGEATRIVSGHSESIEALASSYAIRQQLTRGYFR